MPLDDVNPESWRKLLAATTDYCARPEVAAQFDELGATLGSDDTAAARRGAGSTARPGGLAPSSGGGSGLVAASPLGPLPLQLRPPAHPSGADSPLTAPHLEPQPPGRLTATAAAAAPAPRLGTAKGVLLVEAPRSGFPEAASLVEAAAEAAARLPQLLWRCDLSRVAATPSDVLPSMRISEEQQQQQLQLSQNPQHSASWPLLGGLRTGGAPHSPAAAAAPGAALPDTPGSAARAPLAGGEPGGQQQAASAEVKKQDAGSSPGSSSWLGMLISGMGGAGGSSSRNEQAVSDAGSEQQAGRRSPAAAAATAVAAGSSGGAAAGELRRATPSLSPRGQADRWSNVDTGQASDARGWSGSGGYCQEQQQLVAALGSALQSVAGQLGVVHLALHASGNTHLVGGWGSRVFAVIEPSAEASRLAAEWGRACGHSSGANVQLADLLAGRACLQLGTTGALLSVLSQQRVRTPQGQLVTSWMFELAEPRVDALLDSQLLLPLAAKLARVVVLSASPLPATLVQALLQAGARAVVSGDASAVQAITALTSGGEPAVTAFFAEFYSALLSTGATIPDALAAAEATAPKLKNAFVCHHF
jgi:hypothetical protein